MEVPVKKFPLYPGNEVREGAYFIKCNEVIKTAKEMS